MFTTSLPPRNTILLLDELEEWEDKQNEENKKMDVTSSSCDEAKLKDRKNFGRSFKVPKGAHDPSKTEPKNVQANDNLSRKIVNGNDNPSQQPDDSKDNKLPLHMGLPPAQVPFTIVAGIRDLFT